MLDATIDRDDARLVGAFNEPRAAVRPPVIRLFFLVAVLDLLLEQAVFIIDAIAETWNAERRQ